MLPPSLESLRTFLINKNNPHPDLHEKTDMEEWLQLTSHPKGGQSLWIVQQNLLKMLRDRGYSIPTNDTMTEKQFMDLYGRETLQQTMTSTSSLIWSTILYAFYQKETKQSFYLPHPLLLLMDKPTFPSKLPNQEDGLVVIALKVDKPGKENLRRILQHLPKAGIHHVIFIGFGKAGRELEEACKDKADSLYVEYIEQDSLLNRAIREHAWTPKDAYILSEERTKHILESSHIHPAQLPSANEKDALVRYLGAKKGQVIFAGSRADAQIYYRLVGNTK